MLPYVLRYRLDLLLFAALAVTASLACRRLIRKRRPEEPLPFGIGAVLVGIVVLGVATAEWSGQQQRARLVSLFASFSPTYAYELQRLGHASIRIDTPPDDPTYLAIIDAEKNWLRVNPLIADVYTFRYDDSGKVRMLVDAETDYDHNGRIEGEREQRTAIGEVYEEATEDFHAALRGETRFDTTLVPDRWGVWVASLTPIYSPQGRVEAAVGLDYPADSWVVGILTSRLIALAVVGGVIAVMLTSATAGVLMRAEIRERKAAQEQLRRDKDAVDLLSRAKTEFIGVMTHEIRSPLTALMGYTSLLLESPLNAAQQRYARTIANAGERLVAMLTDIMDLTQLEKGNLVVERVPYTPAAVLNEIADSVTARAMEKGLSLRLESSLPVDLNVVGDPVRLRQVITNLVNNAIKFTDRGSVTLQAEWKTTTVGANGSLLIAIVDTGRGIVPERIARVFDLYGAGRAERAGHAGGTSLAICRQLVERMGGQIAARSELGAGSTFEFSLPCSLAQTDESTTSTKQLDFHAVTGSDPRRALPVLVVNPHPLSRHIMETVLTRNGYIVGLAGSRENAVQQLRRQPYAAVLLDVEEGRLDSAMVARELRRHESPETRVPIIAISAAATENRELYLAAGIDECLTKPVYMPAVLSALHAFVGRPPKSAA